MQHILRMIAVARGHNIAIRAKYFRQDKPGVKYLHVSVEIEFKISARPLVEKLRSTGSGELNVHMKKP